jgi:hypothetical protein
VDKLYTILELFTKTQTLPLASGSINPVFMKLLTGLAHKESIFSSLQNETHYQEAQQIIKIAWPEFSEIVDNVVEIVGLPPTGENFESASSPKLFGLVYYKMDSASSIKWAEVIVHEVAHHCLFVYSASNKFNRLCDWQRLVKSAIRREKRPLIGLLHAVIAESCVIIFYKNLQRICPDMESSSVHSALTKFSIFLVDDFQELNRNFDLTLLAPELNCYIRQAYKIAEATIESFK